MQWHMGETFSFISFYLLLCNLLHVHRPTLHLSDFYLYSHARYETSESKTLQVLSEDEPIPVIFTLHPLQTQGEVYNLIGYLHV